MPLMVLNYITQIYLSLELYGCYLLVHGLGAGLHTPLGFPIWYGLGTGNLHPRRDSCDMIVMTVMTWLSCRNLFRFVMENLKIFGIHINLMKLSMFLRQTIINIICEDSAAFMQKVIENKMYPGQKYIKLIVAKWWIRIDSDRSISIPSDLIIKYSYYDKLMWLNVLSFLIRNNLWLFSIYANFILE
jgi:hypothetical protein